VNNLFLETVLPSEGRYCAVAIDDKQKQIKRQVFVDNLDALERQAQEFDSQGFGSFFALATFDDAGTRKADNARYLKSVFIDMDVGPTKPYKEIYEAAQALRAFIDVTKLPDPLVVNSGGGLHAYWPFTEDIPVEDWKPVARALKALCVQHKLGIDLAVTADAARILRMPGTSNHKLEYPRPVQVVSMGAGAEPFEVFAKRVPAPVSAAPSLDLSAAKAFGTDDMTQAMAGADLPKSKFTKIVRLSVSGSGCNQIKQAVVDAATLEEPLWRAALSIAWNCVDGAKAIHKLSEAHPDYDAEDTEFKAKRLTGKPYKCSWYKENHPSGCEGCAQKITSPIQLGAFIEESPVDEDGVYRVEAAVNPDNEDDVKTAEITIPQYPFPFFRGKAGGVYMKTKTEQGEEGPPACVYEQDLYITSRFFDSDENGDGEGELVGINVHLPHDGVRRFHAPLVSLLATDKLRDTLVKHGVVAYGNQLKLIMAYLAASVKKLQSAAASSRTRNQMGWTSEGTFVVGEFEYTPNGIRLAPAASGTRQLAPLFHQRGSLDEWRKVVDFYNRPGMEAHAFAFLVGAGSPLLQLLNSTQVRGAVLNLVSNKSGTGKTTVQMAINSLFGHPSELLMEAKDTQAARFHRLGTLNSICMTIDELTNASGEQLSHLVYGSTSGRAPHRMEAQTNKLRSNHTTWCSFTVTSSNAVMADALSTNKTAVEGELKRVIDLHIGTPPDIPKDLTDSLFGLLADNYGVAGPVLIQHVVANRETVAALLQDMQAKIDREAHFERSDRFYSAVLAIAMTVAMIGKELGLWNLDIKRIYNYAVNAVCAVKASNSESVGSTDTMAMETLAKYVNDNIANAVVINANGVPLKEGAAGAPAPTTTPRGALKMRYEPDTDELIILASDLKAYFVARRVDFRVSMQAFDTMGALVKSPNGKDLSVVRRIASGVVGAMGAPASRCYVFKGKQLGIEMPVVEDDEDGPAT